MNKRIIWTLPLVLISILQSACVSAVRPDDPAASKGSSLVVDTGATPMLEQALQQVAGERLIYVGETHSRNADHLLQLAVLKALPSDKAALGLEWFQARFQPALDDYIAGHIDEAEMLRRSEYFERWGFDYRFYRPIIRYAREHRIPVVALNANRELTNAIHESGIDGINDLFKAQLPDDYDHSDKVYDQLLRDVFAQHQRQNGNFERFREVQLTWDETMAQRATAYLEGHPGKQLLVLAGRGHIAGRHGIPNRVTRRSGIRGVIIGSYDPGLPARTQADYLVLNDEQPLPPIGLMGALLNIENSRIVISDFVPGSAAKEAGLEKDDRIVAVNGQVTRDFPHFKLLMLDKQPGDEVSVTVMRKGLFSGEEKKTFSFALKAPAQSGMSPHRR